MEGLVQNISNGRVFRIGNEMCCRDVGQTREFKCLQESESIQSRNAAYGIQSLKLGRTQSVDKVKNQWMLGLLERSAGIFFK